MALDPGGRRRLAVEFCGLPFSTPLVLLSGRHSREVVWP